MPGVLLSVQVGLPRTIDDDEPWVTAIHKTPTSGAVWLRHENLDGDGQADLRVHGGADKAVCVYSAEHFEKWQRELGVADCRPGAFGENFSVSGQTETTVCIGDVYRVGSALVQVAQPRGPCWKLARRWERLDFARLVLETGRTGWYLRVLTPGLVAAGDAFDRLERPYPQWTIARVNEVSYSAGSDAEAIRALATCPLLAGDWRASLTG